MSFVATPGAQSASEAVGSACKVKGFHSLQSLGSKFDPVRTVRPGKPTEIGFQQQCKLQCCFPPIGLGGANNWWTGACCYTMRTCVVGYSRLIKTPETVAKLEQPNADGPLLRRLHPSGERSCYATWCIKRSKLTMLILYPIMFWLYSGGWPIFNSHNRQACLIISTTLALRKLESQCADDGKPRRDGGGAWTLEEIGWSGKKRYEKIWGWVKTLYPWWTSK